MEKIYIKDIVDKFNGRLVNGNPDIEICNIQIDSRKAKDNEIFFGIKTDKQNGSDYLVNALEKNVKAAIVDHCDLKLVNETVVVVDDVKKVLEGLCKLKREINSDKKVIAITGSVGKTTTKELLSAMLSRKYKVNKTVGNFNNDLGVPISYLQTYDEDISVLEMGMNHVGEIAYLSNLISPDIRIITNIGSSHIGNLGSKENIFKEKLQIIAGMKEKNLVVNSDDEYLRTIKNCNLYKYSIDEKTELTASNIVITSTSTTFDLLYDGKKFSVSTNLLGKAQVYNILSAIRTALIFEIPIEECLDVVEKFDLPNRRLNIDIGQNGIKVINDTYNASYESMVNGLSVLSSFKNQNTVAIIGDMLEQGDMAKQLHTQIGQLFKKLKIKNAVFIGDNAKYMCDGCKKSHSGVNAKYFKTKEESYEYLEKLLKPLDVVLIKASNAMGFDEIVEKVRNLTFTEEIDVSRKKKLFS